MTFQTRKSYINETPEELFDYVTNQENLPKWSHQVIKSEVKGGGPVSKGSILLQTRKQGKRTMNSEVEVIQHDRPTTHTVRTCILGVTATFSFSFEKQERMTKVTMTGIIQGHGLGRLMAPVIKNATEKADDKVLENLKQVIEKNDDET